jgi:hypothetical protein
MVRAQRLRQVLKKVDFRIGKAFDILRLAA